MAVKTLKVGSSFEEKVDFLSEAEMMKRFDHKVGKENCVMKTTWNRIILMVTSKIATPKHGSPPLENGQTFIVNIYKARLSRILWNCLEFARATSPSTLSWSTCSTGTWRHIYWQGTLQYEDIHIYLQGEVLIEDIHTGKLQCYMKTWKHIYSQGTVLCGNLKTWLFTVQCHMKTWRHFYLQGIHIVKTWRHTYSQGTVL